MSYLVLARKWRPQRFEDVIGQRHVSLTLANAIKSGRLSHAYLFAGPRGVGKTSVARILAKALNCEQGPTDQPCNACDACRAITEGHCLDVLEIDGASNRGIDDVRQLRESVKYAPSSVRSKIYIIDEVHMLTTDAFNALLKTLEEPPKHVCFVMATTEPLKVPSTILSRCQRFDFGRVAAADLQAHLRAVASAESLDLDDDALLLLARKADGGVRDSLTLLDQVVATGEGLFDATRVQEILGLSGTALYFEISAAVAARDPRRALLRMQDAYRGGANLQEVAEELVRHFRNVLLVSFGEGLAEIVEMTSDERSRLEEQLREHRVSPADALRWVRILLDVSGRMRRSGHPRVHLEVALAEMATLSRAVDLGEVLARLRGAGGDPPVTPPPARRRKPEAAGGPESGPERAGADPRPDNDANGPAEARDEAPEPRGDDGGDARWAEVVSRVRRARAFLGSCLHASRTGGVIDGRLQVRLQDANGFKRDQVEQPGNRRLILRTIEEVYGRPLGLRVISRPPQGATNPDPRVEPGTENSGDNEQVAEAPPPETPRPAASTPAPTSPRPTGGHVRERARRIAELMDGDIVGPAM